MCIRDRDVRAANGVSRFGLLAASTSLARACASGRLRGTPHSIVSSGVCVRRRVVDTMGVKEQYRDYVMTGFVKRVEPVVADHGDGALLLSLIHISEPTRPY